MCVCVYYVDMHVCFFAYTMIQSVHVCLYCDTQEARTNYRNFRDLLWNLLFKKHWNDLEKARYVQ